MITKLLIQKELKDLEVLIKGIQKRYSVKYGLGDMVEGRVSYAEIRDYWQGLTINQQDHFLSDHSSEFKNSGSWLSKLGEPYENLPRDIKMAIQNHLEEGRYGKGDMVEGDGAELHSELIGVSISHATLKTEHLISAFMDFLNSKKSELNSEIVNRINKIQSEINALEIDEDGDYVGESEEIAVSILNEDIFDLMNDIAPDGTYFGTTEGDGSDFGFWLIDDDENELN